MSSTFKRVMSILESSSSDSSSEEEALDHFHTLEPERRRGQQNDEIMSPLRARRPRAFIDRNPLQSHQRLYDDYFAEVPAYNDTIFRSRFRMRRDLFLCIKEAVESHEPYFQQRRNAAARLGISSLTKITVALHILAYGVSTDLLNEYLRIGESTSMLCLKNFVKAIISIFGERYLRSPNNDDIARLLEVGERRGFRGMLGSIDCVHWKWINCPSAWYGMYKSPDQVPPIILECVASHDLWIWHALFGLPQSLENINVLERSDVYSELVNGRAPEAIYAVNGNDYRMGYYLAGDIYPTLPAFVKTIPSPQTTKIEHFGKCQESARRDVDRAFELLQARFAIVAGPARYFKPKVLKSIMLACIIMHNMIIEDERHLQLNIDINSAYERHESSPPPPELSRDQIADITPFIQRYCTVKDEDVLHHLQLQHDLVEHLWDKYEEESRH